MKQPTWTIVGKKGKKREVYKNVTEERTKEIFEEMVQKGIPLIIIKGVNDDNKRKSGGRRTPQFR